MAPTNPDWNRAGVGQMSGKIGPLGDPTRWGASVFQQVPYTSVGPHALQSQQFVNVACQDAYARQWSIVGTIGATPSLWAFLDGTGPLTWSAVLSVRMGTAQNSIIHNVNLRAVIDADAPFYADCPPETSPRSPDLASGGQLLRVRAFVIPGAFVANQISVQVVHTVQYAIPPLPNGDGIISTVQLAPVMAGTGL